MKSLDELFDTMPDPIQPLIDWPDDQKDLAIAMAIQELKYTKDTERLKDIIFDAFCGEDDALANALLPEQSEYFDFQKAIMIALYGELEHIINNRIDYYNER